MMFKYQCGIKENNGSLFGSTVLARHSSGKSEKCNNYDDYDEAAG
jgi:hypothetical protein